MKIINKKGKLFGLINIIDLLTIILIISLVLGAFYKFKGDDMNVLTSNKTKEMEYVVRLIPNYEEYFTKYQVGDIIVEDKRELDGTITNISIEDYYTSVEDENGNVSLQIHPYFKQAFITIKATVTDKEPIYKLGKQEIRVGCSNFVTTKLCKMSGFIYEIIE
ncbi:MAG: DUF4330 domain-containing protein [Vallitalea sp.]|jgi:hypothetical protein|nr:DUF4330 domain-containing protein [Vallitalea sp.]